MSRLNFQLEAQATHSHARAGRFTSPTGHGEVLTPVFMPVGTQATVKAQTVETLKTVGSRVLLANTYHLMLRPGIEIFKKFGGIHRFMNWDGPILTDSGGFQIFSLPHSRQMTENGAQFQSYVDGKMHLLSPEKSIEVQKAIQSDIMMVLDQCIPSTAEYAEAKTAMELTHRWAQRSLMARGESSQALFGIVQGACFHDLRKQSAAFLTALPFDGYAIGGLAVGESKNLREEFCEATAALLPSHLPRYLMGVGTPIDILEAVHRGVDMFDCILPSSLAQRGAAFTSSGKLQLRRTAYRHSEEPIDSRCACQACQAYSRAYLHHLIKADEILGWQLIAVHNLHFYHQLMREIRHEILAGTFAQYYARTREALVQADDEYPVKPPKKGRPPRAQRWQKLGDYEIHHSPAGHYNIRQLSSGEIMHSVSDPAQEAELLYIQQSALTARLRDGLPACASAALAPLVIWDVGLGAASNAMAAVRCIEAQQAAYLIRPVQLVSFERDLDPLKLAAKHPGRFHHLRHPAPGSILDSGVWEHSGGRLRWELLEGDFLATYKGTNAPDLVFYDPFSYKTDAALWSAETFKALLDHFNHKATALFTYSASTAVRGALLAAGFFVARGVGTGPKSETTIALTPAALHLPVYQNLSLLGQDWLTRWNRSDAKSSVLDRLIQSHSQFTTHQPLAPLAPNR